MEAKNTKVVLLADYSKRQSDWTHDDIQKILKDQDAVLRQLEKKFSMLRLKSHGLKDTQKFEHASIKVGQHLIDVSDWLTDKAKITKNPSDIENLQKLSEGTKSSIARNERLESAINKDMTQCRYDESKKAVNWGQTATSMVTLGTAAALFVKAHTDKVAYAMQAGIGVATVTGCVAFRYQIKDGFVVIRKAIAGMPTKVEAMKYNARFSLTAIGLTAGVITKHQGEIMPRLALRNANVVIVSDNQNASTPAFPARRSNAGNTFVSLKM